jgi:molybdopterin molybdotransferase
MDQVNEGLLPPEEMRRRLLGQIEPLPPRTVPVAQASGLVLAEDLRASFQLPRFTNAAMDGFALRSADTTDAPARLQVIGRASAGAPASLAVGPGEAIAIATGAAMPEGADAVVPVELVEPDSDTVVVTVAVSPGRHVRAAGEDVQAGVVVLEAGIQLGAGQLSAAAALGRTALLVHPRPRVSVLPTGDEVRPPEATLGPGEVHEAVGAPISALLSELGAVPLVRPIAPDDPQALESAVRDAATDADAVVTVGGVSMGHRDPVRAIEGITAYGLALRPAKPFAFGLVDGVPLFGLPGNPAAALVAFEELVRPAILRMLGRPPRLRPATMGTLAESVRQSPGRFHLVRVEVWREEGRLMVRPAGREGAGMVHSLARARGWMEMAADVGRLSAGAQVRVRLLGDVT